MGCTQSTSRDAPAEKKYGAYKHFRPATDYADKAAKVVHGQVRMFSGCQDSQTSADVFNVASFGLPQVEGASAAGGACTNAMLSTLKKHPKISFADLLLEMQKVLKEKKYTQVPQLSSSQQVNLKKETFDLTSPETDAGQGRTKALLIGINYPGQKGELKGCVNDVKMMRDFIKGRGFSESPEQMRILADAGGIGHAEPTAKNIFAGLKWLLTDVKPGDSLFFHYSGHGGQMPDQDGDEEDGYDETLVPCDYNKAGQIRDDTIFKMMVAPLPEGAQLVAVFDCCHSGTILDLPYAFAADDENCAALEKDEEISMFANGKFDLGVAHGLVQSLVSSGGKVDFNEVGNTLKKMALKK